MTTADRTTTEHAVIDRLASDRLASDQLVADPTAAELDRRQISARLLRFGRPVLAPLGLSLVSRVAAQLLGIALPALGAWGVTRVVDHASVAIAPLVATMVALSLAKGVLRYLEQLAGHWVAFRALAMLRTEVYARLVPQSPAGVLSRHTGDLLARATKDVDRIEVFFAHTLVPAVAAVVVPVAVLLGLALAVDPVLALALAPFLVVAGAVVPRWGRDASAVAAAEVRRSRGEVAQLVTESMQGVREVLAFGAEQRRRDRTARAGAEIACGLGVLGAWTARRRGVNGLLVPLGFVTVVLVGAARVGSGSLDWSDVVVACVVALGAFESVLAVEDVAPDLEQAFASARRVWEVTDAPPATSSAPRCVPLPAGPLDVTFESVEFAYPGGSVRALDDVTLTLPPGTTTAVVGASGAGKSTLVHLLTRAWDPDAGRVLLGGVDVRDVSLHDLRAHVAVVSQSTYLFNDTVAANLRLARPDATDAELVDACRRASLHDTVVALPLGYATVVGEMGERLSGGQRQRVALARALLVDAPVLVLDEATSQLDATSEAEIADALAEAGRGRTVLVIAHRPGAVRAADRVLQLEHGRLATGEPTRR